MLLLRLNSLIPFSALNYIGGVTGVTLTDFTLSLVGIIPEFIVYVIIGGAAQGTLFAFNTSIYEVQYILLVIGLVAAIFALFSIIHLAHLELDKVSTYPYHRWFTTEDLFVSVYVVLFMKFFHLWVVSG